MLQTRIIPCLQLIDESLVKAVQFDKFGYIGDPCNTVRIFNELEVDELCFLDIRASREKRKPNYNILQDIADECFMPLSYGGGITSFEEGKKILTIGFEKLILNTQAYVNPSLIKELSEHFGAQAIVGSIDVKRRGNQLQVYIEDGSKQIAKDPVTYARELEQLGVGEILLTAMAKEGTWEGFDIELVKAVTNAVNIPVIAHGGAGNVAHIEEVVKIGKASAVALGSMLVYQKKGFGVLVNFPDKQELEKALS